MSRIKFSQRIQKLSPSQTVGITTRAKGMKAKGIDVIAFSIGEPDFDTPNFIKEAAIDALKGGFTKYTPPSGIEELRNAISIKLERDNGLSYKPNQIIVSSGAKESIYNLIQVLCEVGDEVIIPAPYWVSYPEQVKLAGAEPVIISTAENNGFKLSARQLQESLTPKMKLLILNSPSNPTGIVYRREELAELAEVIETNNIHVISDEVYEKLIYQGEGHVSIAQISERVKQLTLVVNGLSKTYAMTGWRIGYAAGNEEIIKTVAKLQSQTTSHPNSIAQKAGVAALIHEQTVVKTMVAEFHKRRDYIVDRLQALPGVRCMIPEGAFYVFPNISAWKGRSIKGESIHSSADFARVLLEEAQVAVVPGSAFGSDDHVRFSYAASIDTIKTGLDRIEDLLVQSQN